MSFWECSAIVNFPLFLYLQGNVTGQNEFIIYTHYRAMPAYVVEYTVP